MNAEAKSGDDGFAEYRKGEFPEAFERLCAMSIKPVASLRFKRDCLAAWERYGRYLKVFELFRDPDRKLERAHEDALAASAMPFGGRLS